MEIVEGIHLLPVKGAHIAGETEFRVDRILRDGDVIEVGRRRPNVIHAPGHSPGNVCYYEPSLRALFAGDTFQAGTTRPPGWVGLVIDAVSHYRSMERIAAMDVEWSLPAHLEIASGPEAKRRVWPWRMGRSSRWWGTHDSTHSPGP